MRLGDLIPWSMHGSPQLLSLPTFSISHQLAQIPIGDNDAAAVDDDNSDNLASTTL